VIVKLQIRNTEITENSQEDAEMKPMDFSVSSVAFLRFLCSVFLIFSASNFIATSAYSMPGYGNFEQVKQDTKASEAWLLDRHGTPLHRLRVNKQVRRGEWVALQDMSPALREAMVLSEDKRFYEHSGIDWKAVSAAAWGNLFNQRTRGASTLSMQLASLIDEGPRTGNERKSILGKAGQAISATQLERSWRKDQILEAYLNLVPFRGEIQGIDALSRTLFDKAAHGLDAREAAIAAALVRAPNAKAQVVAQRACGILRNMQGSVQTKSDADCAALSAYTQAVLPRKAWQPSDGIAPHVAQKLLASSKASAARLMQMCSVKHTIACSSICVSCRGAMCKMARSWCLTMQAAKCSPMWAHRAT
jgi:penicillin-binding protein 1C